MIKITEKIPNNMPTWAMEAMNKGHLWKTAFQEIEHLRENRDFWRKEYWEMCEKEDIVIEKHCEIIKKLITSDKDQSMEKHLFDLYKQFKELRDNNEKKF